MSQAGGPASTRPGPLAGLKVLDVSRFVAGPFAAQVLGHLGADVVKVEQPESGDPMRHLSKHAISLGSAHFLSANASKRSLTLDLGTAKGRDVFLRLLAGTDALVENFRPGVMERLGLARADLVARNPRLIVASISGFGQSGPWRDWVAYDLIAQAAGGAMSLTGWPGERAAKMGVPIGDLGASLYLVIGLLAALHRRDRLGHGEIIDVGMMDVQLSLLNYHAQSFWLSGEEPQPQGDGHPNIVPYQAFDSKTRPFVVAVYGDRFWPGFCKALDAPGLRDDPRFDSNAKRCLNKATLVALLQTVFARHSREHWIERLSAEGVPVGPLNTVGEAVGSPQALAREMTVELPQTDGTSLRMLGSPIKFNHCDPVVGLPPALGADTDQVLATWGGFAQREIAALREAHVV
ncbi:MAG: CoA transferase [Alphaproteobacteria bacterium]|nr:CoA transferase [Alphaproteobacteria bacterium]